MRRLRDRGRFLFPSRVHPELSISVFATVLLIDDASDLVQ
jgi:hypothetical protein